jgi:hypothetical protein
MSAFISVHTPSTSVDNLDTYWVADPTMTSMERCFKLKFSRSWSISASLCLTVDRLEISPDAATD